MFDRLFRTRADTDFILTGFQEYVRVPGACAADGAFVCWCVVLPCSVSSSFMLTRIYLPFRSQSVVIEHCPVPAKPLSLPPHHLAPTQSPTAGLRLHSPAGTQVASIFVPRSVLWTPSFLSSTRSRSRLYSCRTALGVSAGLALGR